MASIIFIIQVLLKMIEEGTISTTDDFHLLCQKMLSPLNKFCPGLSEAEYQEFRKDICYEQSNVHVITEIFKRIEFCLSNSRLASVTDGNK